MKKIHLVYALLLSVTMIFVSCKKDESETPAPVVSVDDDVVFVVNEGPFQNGTGSVSVFYRNSKTVIADIFQQVNNRPLGNIAQSMNIFNGKAYIVVNNSAKIEVIGGEDYKSIGVITGFTSPRFFLGIDNNKAYVTDWANNVAVVDLSTNTITKTILTKTGPEQMLRVNDNVFVLNSGGWGVDSAITVINAVTDQVVNTINIALRPTGMVLDKNNKLWVLCSGKGFNGYPGAGDTKGHLMCINTTSFTVEKDLEFPSNSEHPEKLTINSSNEVLYYNYNGGVYSFSINENALPVSPVINRSFYAIGYDYRTGYIYGADPVDYVQNGWIHRYEATTGAKVDSFQVGVIPTAFYFN